MSMFKEAIEEDGDEIVFISPISKYEHSGVSYFLGQRSGWDYGVVGFCFVTKANLKELGLDLTENEILAYLTSELHSTNG